MNRINTALKTEICRFDILLKSTYTTPTKKKKHTIRRKVQGCQTVCQANVKEMMSSDEEGTNSPRRNDSPKCWYVIAIEFEK